MSFTTADIVDYMRHEIFQLSIRDSKKKGRCHQSERDYPYPAEKENTKTKLAEAARISPNIVRYRKQSV